MMRLHKKGWTFMVAVALVVGMTSTALAIEAFQERFEWGDMSKPTTLQGRVIILDPYDEAVWINVAGAAMPRAACSGSGSTRARTSSSTPPTRKCGIN